jgi:hypothetical protein
MFRTLSVMALTVVLGCQGAVRADLPGPAVLKLDELPLRESVSQYGITWTFEGTARVGRFVTGDYYVVGPVTVTAIDPKPLYGNEVPKDTIDDKERQEYGGENRRLDEKEKAALKANPNYCRNGSVLNIPPVLRKSGFDSRVRHRLYDPAMTTRLPIKMSPGDALVSTISKGKLKRNTHYSPVGAVAILTCLKEPVPADAFRPGYMDPEKTIYLARNLKRELLPRLAKVEKTPDPAKLAKYFSKPWLEYNLFHEDWAPHQASRGYGQGLSRIGGSVALVLCLDFTPEEKEPLLIGYCQFGIDLFGMLKRGHKGWEAYGGWNSGHKHPIILAGVLLGDDKMASPSKTFPKASFHEDEQTGYGRTWRGAPVMFLGHSGVDAASGKGRTRRNKDWGPYEHKHPSKWHARNWQSESYRRCCNSRTWQGTALACRLMALEKYWAHDAFFDYVDRWMSEDETEALKVMAEVGHKQPEWSWQGKVEVQFHEDMWKKYRRTVEPDVNAWRKRAPVDHPATISK